MKLRERVIEQRLRHETTISKNQFGFIPRKSTMEAIYLGKRLRTPPEVRPNLIWSPSTIENLT